mgnify:CR=1 FL=1|tara:strand:+ start:129 stop:335 length:207 start_codon:yes stop_codon:yes gene_type:complete
MDEICKVAHCDAINLNFIESNGDESGPIEGYLVQVFVPAAKTEDVDRNDAHRREVTAIMAAAIEAAGG